MNDAFFVSVEYKNRLNTRFHAFYNCMFFKGGLLGIKTHTCTFVNFCHGRLSLKPRSCVQFAHGVQHLACIFGHVNSV